MITGFGYTSVMCMRTTSVKHVVSLVCLGLSLKLTLSEHPLSYVPLTNIEILAVMKGKQQRELLFLQSVGRISTSSHHEAPNGASTSLAFTLLQRTIMFKNRRNTLYTRFSFKAHPFGVFVSTSKLKLIITIYGYFFLHWDLRYNWYK